MHGLFVSFEGIDGCGKSTQIELLSKKLNKTNYTVVTTEEPGGTSGAHEIRKLLLRENKLNWSVESETLLFMAARRDHVEKVIKPAINQNNIVICDRFMDSTTVYQGMRSAQAKAISLYLFKLIGIDPDITFLIDMEPETALDRALNRKSKENRFENYGLKFQKEVRKKFLEIADNHPKRFKVINGNQSISQIGDQVYKLLLEKLQCQS